jgi:hypothetical protein
MNEEMESFAILCVEYLSSYFCQPMLVDSFRSEKISGDVRQDLTLEEPASSEAADLPDQPNEPMNNTEDARHIMNLENQVKILKKQVLSAHAQAEKCSTLENQIKSLEDQVSMYVSKIEGLNRVVDMTRLLEDAGNKMLCKWLHEPPSCFDLLIDYYILLLAAGVQFNAASKNIRVQARVDAVARISKGNDMLWAEPNRLLPQRLDEYVQSYASAES